MLVEMLRAALRLGGLLVAGGLAFALPLLAAERTLPVLEGDPFPATVLSDLNAPAGPATTVDLAQSLGKKPVVLCYWIAGQVRSEEVLKQLQSLVAELGSDRIALYSIVKQQPGREANVIRERIRAQGIRVPVLDDKDFRIGNMLQIRTVPHISIIDREGRLRLSNGASLSQVLEYKMDLAGAIRRAAETGKVGTYGRLERYYPVQELVGKRSPDFTATLLSKNVEQRWSSMLDARKLNVLIFWSIDCPHCRKVLPEINEWLKKNPGDVNIVSAAMIDTPATKVKTREFCDLNRFVFPTLADEQKISEQFLVTSTPTIVIIRPNGVIDSVLLSDLKDFGQAIEEKKRTVLGAAGS